MRTLIVYCHPNPESFCHAVFNTAQQTLVSAGHELRCIDLYAESFQPIMTREERANYLTNPKSIEVTVQSHVDALLWAQHLVFVFPIWYYGPPAMLKGWLERVWLPGVAFLLPSKKGQAAQPNLQHIQHLTVLTHGGAPWWWLKVIGDPCKRMFMRGLRAIMAKRCRSTWLQLHSMNSVTPSDCAAFLKKVQHKLLQIR